MCVCRIPVPKQVVFADSFVYERMQGAAGLPPELQPTKTSDGKCENAPAEHACLRFSEDPESVCLSGACTIRSGRVMIARQPAQTGYVCVPGSNSAKALPAPRSAGDTLNCPKYPMST